MELKKLKPTSNGTRHQLQLKKNLLCKYTNIIKYLKTNYTFCNGRSHLTGHITSRHKSNFTKKKIPILQKYKQQYFGIVLGIINNTIGTSLISLNFDLKKKQFFQNLAIKNLTVGSLICHENKEIPFYNGNSTLLENLPVGSIISLLSQKNKITYIKAAGTFGQLLEKTNRCRVRLPSGKMIFLNKSQIATIGPISNERNFSIVDGKAGKRRYQGKRPYVRGIAMNPVDHPHGGRTNGGCIPVTPWGIPTKGKKTVKIKNK